MDRIGIHKAGEEGPWSCVWEIRSVLWLECKRECAQRKSGRYSRRILALDRGES